jgi:putative transposase
VFIEDLNVKGILESPENTRNKAEVGWRDFITVLEHHGEKNACHVVQVNPRGTTKECASCGVSTDKSLWIREHSCPSCGFETDRNWNAALNVLSRRLAKLGVVHSEATPAETATAVSTDGGSSVVVDASRVVETGSPALKEAAAAAE